MKNLPAMQDPPADLGLIPGSGRSPGGGNGNPLQYSCLENPMDGGAWQTTVPYGVTKSRTGLSDFTFTFFQSSVTIKELIYVRYNKKQTGLFSSETVKWS